MLTIRVAAAATAFIMLSGFSLTDGYDIDKVRATGEGASAVTKGSAFTKALTDEYRSIAVFEADQMYDWPDAGYFARKGLFTADGNVAEPEAVGSWNLPKDKVNDLSAARGELISLLSQGAREKAPELAAKAQGRYDCWIEQQEENHQADHIAVCRGQFASALDALKGAMMPKAVAQPAAAQVPAVPERFIVYFDFDKATLNPASREVVDMAVAAAKKAGSEGISVTGHADRSGPNDYNMDLSLRRAESVRDVVAKLGVTPSNVSLAGRGEAQPAVPTEDGVRMPANRRVEIIITQ